MCLKGPVENIDGINGHQIEKNQNDHILYLCIDRYVLGTLYNEYKKHIIGCKKDTDYL